MKLAVLKIWKVIENGNITKLECEQNTALALPGLSYSVGLNNCFVLFFQLGSTRKEIKQAESARDGKRRTADEEHFQERAKAARQLMAEIIAETPTLPPEPEPRLRTSQRASRPDQTVTKPTGRQKQPPKGSGTRKGKMPNFLIQLLLHKH